MVDGTVVNMKHASVLYQISAEGEIPEAAIVIRLYEAGVTLGIIQGDSEINLNVETLPLLIKELKSWDKICKEL
jgi:hypothetical protein